MSDTVAVRELLEGRIFTPLEVSFWQRCDGPTMLDGRTDGTELFAFPSAVSQTILDGVGADLYALLSHSDAASKVAARHGVVFPPRPPAPVWDENFPGTLGQYRAAVEKFRFDEDQFSQTVGQRLLHSARRAVLHNAGAVECDVEVSSPASVTVSTYCSCSSAPASDVSVKVFSVLYVDNYLWTAPVGSDVDVAFSAAHKAGVSAHDRTVVANKDVVVQAVECGELYDRRPMLPPLSDDLSFSQWRVASRQRSLEEVELANKMRVRIDRAVAGEDFSELKTLLPRRYARMLKDPATAATNAKESVLSGEYGISRLSDYGCAQLVELFSTTSNV